MFIQLDQVLRFWYKKNTLKRFMVINNYLHQEAENFKIIQIVSWSLRGPLSVIHGVCWFSIALDTISFFMSLHMFK